MLFLPLGFLLLTLLALAASNIQRGFRSNWLLALGGASLAWLSLLFLRFQLPLELSRRFWWAGRGLEYNASFALNEVSWPLAFLVCGLLVISLLMQVQDAMRSRWYTWASPLAAGSAALLACLAAEPLTLFLGWTLLDLATFAPLMFAARGPEQRLEALRPLPLHLLGGGLLLAAWTLSFYGAELQSWLLVLAGGLRLGLWTPGSGRPAPAQLRGDLGAMLLHAPLVAGLAAFGLAGALGAAGGLALLLILLPSLYAAFRWLWPSPVSSQHWLLACGGLAAAAAVAGQPRALVAYAVLLFFGLNLLAAVQYSGRLRRWLALLGALLCGLPFTASQGSASLFAASAFTYPFLLVHAALVAGWLRLAQQAPAEAPPAEPWMQTTQRIGHTLTPVVLLAFGLGLLPIFEAQSIAWWPGGAVAALGAALLFVCSQLTWRPSTRAQVRLRWLEWLLSLGWLAALGRAAQSALGRLLGAAAGLLEGRAGVLWALLVMTLLASLLTQLGAGG
ncbi:MAG: hypothetical protein KIS85_04770 [Anaerolineales bacterium]|nr:hypothetical protein [Anaerolineales bacterium]